MADNGSELKALQTMAHRAFMVTAVTFVAYGIHSIVACVCMYLIYNNKRQESFRTFYIAYTSALFLLCTAHISFWSVLMVMGSKMIFLPHDAPILNDMPSSFIAAGVGVGVISVIVTSLCEGFLLYRCYVIWGKRVYVNIVPTLAFLSAFSLSVAAVTINWKYRRHMAEIPIQVLLRLTDAYWYNLISLNSTLSFLIVARLAYLYRQHFKTEERDLSGNHDTENSRTKRSVRVAIAVITESSLLYSISCTIGIGFNWWFFPHLNFPPQTMPILDGVEVHPLTPFLLNIECIAAELIFLRIALGRAWSESASIGDCSEMSQIQFKGDFKQTTDTSTAETTTEIAEMSTFLNHSTSSRPEAI